FIVRIMMERISAPADHSNVDSYPTRRSTDLCGRDEPRTYENTTRGRQARRTDEPVWVQDEARVPRRAGEPKGDFEQRGTAHRYPDRKSTRLNSSHVKISYAIICLQERISP